MKRIYIILLFIFTASSAVAQNTLVTPVAPLSFPGWMVSMQNPNVRAIVSYEPGGYVFPETEVPAPMPSLTGTLSGTGVPMAEFMKLTKIPIVLYFGDYIPEEVTDKLGSENWRVRLQMGRKFVETTISMVETPRWWSFPK